MNEQEIKQAMLQPSGGRYFTSLPWPQDDERWSNDAVWAVACDFHPPQQPDSMCGAILLLPRPEEWVQQSQENLASLLAAYGWQLHPWAGIAPPDITARCPLHTCKRCESANADLPAGELRFGASVKCWGEIPDKSAPGGYRLLKEGE